MQDSQGVKLKAARGRRCGLTGRSAAAGGAFRDLQTHASARAPAAACCSGEFAFSVVGARVRSPRQSPAQAPVLRRDPRHATDAT